MRILEAIPATLVFLMQQRGLTQGELARRSGIHKGQLSGYLNGRTQPKLEQLLRVVDGLEVELSLFAALLEKMRELQARLENRAAGDVLRGADPVFAALVRSALDAGAPDEAARGDEDWLEKMLRAQRLALESQRLFLEALEERSRAGG